MSAERPPGGLRGHAAEAELELEPGADRRAPGGAVTVALCGGWDHEPPCPLAPHLTTVAGPDSALVVRTLFAAAPADEREVRTRIEAALAGGGVTGPDGVRSRWRVLRSGSSPTRPDERATVERLLGR